MSPEGRARAAAPRELPPSFFAARRSDVPGARAQELRAQYVDWPGKNGEVYKRVSLTPVPGLQEAIDAQLGPVEMLGMGYRLNFNGPLPNAAIHSATGVARDRDSQAAEIEATLLPLRIGAGGLLTDSTPIQPPPPSLPPTREQHQQARRLEAASIAAAARFNDALESSGRWRD